MNIKYKNMIFMSICIVLLSGCGKKDREVHLREQDYICYNKIDVTEKLDKYTCVEESTQFGKWDLADFYQAVNNKYYYIDHKDMDQRTSALKAEIGYYDAELDKKQVLFNYDEGSVWLNEMVVWDHFLVWQQIKNDAQIVKYDMDTGIKSTLYSPEWPLSLIEKDGELLFYDDNSVISISIATGEKKILQENEQLTLYGRVDWQDDVSCYVTKQNDKYCVSYSNHATKQNVQLLLDSKYVSQFKANNNFIAWLELRAYNDHTDNKICIYDVKEDKAYRYNPEEATLLYQLCDVGCLINIRSSENGPKTIREWDVEKESFSTIYIKKEENGYAGIMRNGDSGWYVPFNKGDFSGMLYINKATK